MMAVSRSITEKAMQLAKLIPFAFLLAACGDNDTRPSAGDNSGDDDRKVYRWKMVTTWPKNFPALGVSAERLAARVNTMSRGRLKIKVYGAGELVKALGVFDAVQSNTAQMGHGAAYYWRGKIPEAVFFSTVPFGMIPQEMNAWLYYGGGLDLWRRLYAKHNLYPLPAGNTGTQMAGWFNKEIRSIESLKGLKMRIPGIGGEVFSRAGGESVILPGSEIFTSLQTGVIDAAEWVGPYNDLAFGLHDVARYYYYPGWHDPGTVLEAIVNLQAFEALPDDLQAILVTACRAASQDLLDELNAQNRLALKELVEVHGVELRRIPDDVLKALGSASREVLDELVASSSAGQEIYDSIQNFRKDLDPYRSIAEQAFLEARALDESRP